MTGPFRDAIVQSLRRAVVPLVAYYTVTLVIPLTNGAARAGSGFGKHALVVVVVPCVIIVLGGALRTIAGYAGGVLRRGAASVDSLTGSSSLRGR